MTSTPLPDALRAQEEAALFDTFDETAAFRLGMTLREIAEAAGAPVVINVRTADRTLFHTALPGSSPDNDHWVRRKSNTCLRNQQSSLRVGETLASKGRSVGPEIGLDPLDHAAHGGSFPIRLKGGMVVAAVTVSGLPSVEDHRMIIAGLERFLGKTLPKI